LSYTADESPVVLNLTDVNGCAYTATLTINEYPVTPNIANSVTVCEGDSYTWPQNGLSYTADDSPVVLNLTDGNGCPYTATLTINEYPVTDAGITNNTGTTELTCTVQSISVTATGGGTYSWSDGTTEVSAVAALAITAPGTYTVTVTAANGCADTEFITITQDESIPDEPSTLNCWDEFVFNSTTCVWDNIGIMPAEPTNLKCWETAVFDEDPNSNTYCSWVVTGVEPTEPTFVLPDDESETVECPSQIQQPNPPVVMDIYGNPIIPTGPEFNSESVSNESIGNTEVYSKTIKWGNQLAMPVTFTEIAKITSISIYHEGGTGNMLLGVYSDQGGYPSSRLGITDVTIVNASAGWQTVQLLTPVSVVTGQKVWLSWVFQKAPGIRYTAGIPGRAASSNTWANGMPEAFGTSTIASNKYSIYCNYSVGEPNTMPECEGDVTYTWTYTDCSGKWSQDWKYRYLISPPVVNMPPDGFKTVACKADANAPEPPVVYDNCGRMLYAEFVGEYIPLKWGWKCEGTVVWLYRYTDCTGKTYDWKYTIDVEYEDFQIPLADKVETITCPDQLYTPTPPVVYDNCGVLLVPKGPEISPIPDCEGTVTYVWTYTDCEGNTHDWKHTFVIKTEYSNCETAFARGVDNQCFLNDGFNRWGWTNKISPSDVVSLPLWAGAPVCDPVSSGKGNQVGTVDISYVGTNVNIKYKLTGNYRMTVAHVNVGCEPYPTSGVAPGLFTFNSQELNHLTEAEVTFTNVQGDIYIIAHAVVCKGSFGCCAFGKVFNPVNLNINCTDGTNTANKGNTDIYGNIIKWGAQLAMPVTFTESGEITSVSIYHEGGTGNMLLGVYSDQGAYPSTRLGITDVTLVNASAGWQTVQLLTPVSVVTGQKVWLSWVFQKAPGIRYTAGTPGRAASSNNWANQMPVAFGTSTIAPNKYSIYCTYTTQGSQPDVIAPVVSAFSIPSTSSTLTVPVSSFTATDNKTVTGYLVTESATAPLAGDAGWSASAPASYVFVTEGTKTLYAWAKDAAGNVSASMNDQVIITLPGNDIGNTAIYGNTIKWGAQLAMPVTFTESGEITSVSIYHEGGTGNMLLGVYSDQGGFPSSRLGITATTLVSASAGWQTIQLSTPVPVVTGQKVWLSWVFQNAPAIRYTSGTPGRAASSNNWANQMPVAFGTSTIAPNKYSIYCTYTVDGNKSAEIATGITPDIELADLKVYPNPFSDRLRFEFVSPESVNARIDLYDMTGRMVKTIFEQPIEGGVSYEADFKPETIISGMYIYRVTLGESVYNGKVVFKKE
jgi:hypothetical protein